MKKKIIITGSSGFLGSELMKVLAPYNDVYGCDIIAETDIFNLKGLTNMDILIHCAALTSVPESFKRPEDYYRTNILGTAHLANLCLQSNTQMIYISSAAIFEPFANPYADSKFQAHQIVDCLSEELRALIFVPYNIYSIKPKPSSLMGKFLSSPELTIFGNGKQTRDFINITDVCDIIRTAIDEEWESETIEIGTGIGTTVNEIASIFEQETNKKVVHVKKSGGVKHSHANISHLREHYTKPFKTNLERDIEKMCLSLN